MQRRLFGRPRTSRLRACRGAVLLLALLGGCGGPADEPLSPAHGRLVGDWFRCARPNCAQLVQWGMRFHGDGTWVALEAEPPLLEPEEAYCSFVDSVRRYEPAGTRLHIQGRYNVQFLEWTPVFSEDGATMTLWIGPDPVTPDQGPRQVETWRRLPDATRSAPCRD